MSAQPLQLLSRESFNPRYFHLSDEDWRWLGKKRLVKVAVWQPQIPPLSIFTPDGKYEGMTADYLMLVASYLGLQVEVRDYGSRDEALKALSQQEVDMMIDVSGKEPPYKSELIYSHRFINDHPVLVHAKTSSSGEFQYRPGMHLAIARWYVDDAWINDNFPGVKITHYENDEQALASVAFHKNDFFVGNLVTTSYLLDRNYSNYLEFQAVYPARDTGSRFLVRQGEEALLKTVNSALAAIPLSQAQVIMQQWSEGADLWRLRKNVAFTSRERRWIERHPVVNVSVNAFYAPFTMTDARGDFYGVTADVLALISQRTGIHFKPLPAKSLDAMQQQVDQGEALFIGASIQSDERNEAMLYTRPYFNSPFVTVRRPGDPAKAGNETNLRIALVKGNPLAEKLLAEYPGAKLVETANASVAMQNVVEGKADIAVHTLFGASYMINRYFQNKLEITGTIDAPDGALGFAVSRNQPELLGILNKALENISPSDISDIIKKWQIRPDVRLNTWELYRKQFWLVTGIAAVIVLISLIWIFYMRREILARQKAQTGLAAQLKFNEALINTLPLPVYVTDLQGNLQLYNQSLNNFFTGPDHALSDKTSGKENHPLHALWHTVTGRISQSGDVSQPLASQERIFDGERYRSVLHYAVTYTDANAQPQGFICTWLDMTDQEELYAALSEARERAEQANRAKSTFLATMSHEIRTPVSAIIGLLELAVKTTQSEADKEDTIRVAWESARTLMGLIGDILDMARIESGRLELAPEWVRTNALLPPIVRVFEGLARQKSLRLRSSLPATLPYEIFVDPLRFRQVLSNLVSNAIKFTEQGTIEVDLYISYGKSDEDARLRVSVEDTGRGMTEEEQADIFDPWVQARAGRAQSGSGLGLAICAQLVNMMGGEIMLRSRAGHGTKVTFEIPATFHMERQTPEAMTSEEITASGRTLSILAVDDHPANRMLLRHQLAHLGHIVTEAKDGEEAWAKWQGGEFDVVITDCSMPGMDGLALTRLIRTHQRKPLTILGLTANAWPEERNRCLDAGMDDCLFKPLQLPQLQAILEKAAEQAENAVQAKPAVPEASAPAIQNADVPEPLENLLNFSDLEVLTNGNAAMRYELLTVTLASNIDDLRMAEDLYELEDWPEMASCIHRISGAAQIIGARRAEMSCRALEKACLEPVPDTTALAALWHDALQEIAMLNSSLDYWLKENKV
ncbi:transporter substrate-binding domain-containing protein [Pantoea sp. M_9]|uniref:transporter substrate-binding domain-containing protein n=1 Tax=Pantoea sp. M_9 TaxID=2608041 RepID=UPI00168022C2|nr:transporter substrate-binding domain-containing protein [Pantoea sp. M_9]